MPRLDDILWIWSDATLKELYREANAYFVALDPKKYEKPNEYKELETLCRTVVETLEKEIEDRTAHES